MRQARVRAEADWDGEEPTLDAEDGALLLRCWQVLRGPLLDAEAKPIRFAHVFVDEVQDASPIELRVLLELTGKDRCITRPGDVAQRMLEDGDDRGEFDWNALIDGLGVPHTRIPTSKRSAPIDLTRLRAFARAILGPLSHEDLPKTTRSGPPVELFGFASPGEATARPAAEVLKQLARDEPDANVAFDREVPAAGGSRLRGPRARGGAGRPPRGKARLLVGGGGRRDRRAPDQGTRVRRSRPARDHGGQLPGLPSQARHALYVGATRASHQLWCVASQAPSELVTAALGPAEEP